MNIRTNLYLITAILLTSNFLRLCEGDNNVDHEIFSDHLNHLDHLDDLHDINNFDDDKVIHSVEIVRHNGDPMTKYASTSQTNKETNNELFTNTISNIQQSNVPTTFTKVVKQTVIKQSNSDGNNSPKTDLSMNNILYSNNKLKENGIGSVENISLPPIPSQPVSDLQGNIKNIIHTTVTKTTTSGIPSYKLNESFNRINNLDALSTMSSTNSNYNNRIAGSSSSQSNSMDENSKSKTTSATENIIDGSGFDNFKRISRAPGGSFRRLKTTIINQHNINDSNDYNDLGKSTIGFNRENTSLNNIVSSMTNPLGYNTITTGTVDRDNVFNKGIPSRIQQTSFNKFNALGNLVSKTGALQNPGPFVQTKTTIIKNERAANENKLDDLNNNRIDYNVDDGVSTSNNIVNLNYGIKSSNNNGNDNDSGYSYSYDGFGNGMNDGNYNNIGDIVSSNHLMDGSLSEGYSSYILLPDGYGKRMGKGKKIKKNGRTRKGSRSKNISFGKGKGNEQIRVKNGRNYKNTRSSKNRSGGNAQYYSSNTYVRGGKNRSSSSSASFSDELSMKKKIPCHCNNEERKLNKRDSSESNESSHSKEHRGPGINYLGSSMDNQPMQNNSDAKFLSPLPPSMERESQSNLLFDLIQRQRPDQSLNYSQSDLTAVLNMLEKMRNQLINDQLTNSDVSNQYLTYQIPNMSSLFKSDSQQRQYFGTPGLGLGLGTEQGLDLHPDSGSDLQADPFDSKPYFVGDYPKYLEQNLQLPPLTQPSYPYSFNQDFYSDLSKMGLNIPKYTDIQSGQDNQINSYTNLPQTQQDTESTGFNRMDELNSGFMTMRIPGNMIRNTDDRPIIRYFKTIKTTKDKDGNDIPDIRIIKTQLIPIEN